jgi:hypothetical protein
VAPLPSCRPAATLCIRENPGCLFIATNTGAAHLRRSCLLLWLLLMLQTRLPNCFCSLISFTQQCTMLQTL